MSLFIVVTLCVVGKNLLKNYWANLFNIWRARRHEIANIMNPWEGVLVLRCVHSYKSHGENTNFCKQARWGDRLDLCMVLMKCINSLTMFSGAIMLLSSAIVYSMIGMQVLMAKTLILKVKNSGPLLKLIKFQWLFKIFHYVPHYYKVSRNFVERFQKSFADKKKWTDRLTDWLNHRIQEQVLRLVPSCYWWQ